MIVVGLNPETYTELLRVAETMTRLTTLLSALAKRREDLLAQMVALEVEQKDAA